VTESGIAPVPEIQEKPVAAAGPPRSKRPGNEKARTRHRHLAGLGAGAKHPCPPEATGAKRNSYMAKLKILPRSAGAELTGEVNSPVRPEGRTPAFE